MPEQFYPLEPHQNELLLRLKRHSNVALTPPRMRDTEELCEIMNHYGVYQWSRLENIPFSIEEAKAELQERVENSEEVFKALAAATDSNVAVTVGRCPVDSIRIVHEDGGASLIGGVHITRCDFGEFLGPCGPQMIDWENKEENLSDNETLEVGDPRIVWTIGIFLSPQYHGQGIASDVISTILHDWAIPRMGVRRMLAFTFEGNDGSVRALCKNGFKFLFTSVEHMVVRGMWRGVNVLEWKLEEEE